MRCDYKLPSSARWVLTPGATAANPPAGRTDSIRRLTHPHRSGPTWPWPDLYGASRVKVFSVEFRGLAGPGVTSCGTSVGSVTAIATRRIDCRQFFKVKLGDRAQPFRRTGILEAFGHVVEPGAVFILESQQRRDGDCPTTRTWQGTRRPRCGRGVLTQFGAPARLPFGSGHWSGAEAGSGHGRLDCHS